MPQEVVDTKEPLVHSPALLLEVAEPILVMVMDSIRDELGLLPRERIDGNDELRDLAKISEKTLDLASLVSRIAKQLEAGLQLKSRSLHGVSDDMFDDTTVLQLAFEFESRLREILGDEQFEKLFS